MTYTPTNFSNITTMNDFLQSANSNAGNYLFTGILVMIYMILFLSMISFGIEASLLTASFITFIVALFMAYLGLVSWMPVGACVGIIIFTIFYIMWSNRYD
jgi:hypothetical protein